MLERNECAPHMCHAPSPWSLLFSIVSGCTNTGHRNLTFHRGIQYMCIISHNCDLVHFTIQISALRKNVKLRNHYLYVHYHHMTLIIIGLNDKHFSHGKINISPRQKFLTRYFHCKHKLTLKVSCTSSSN